MRYISVFSGIEAASCALEGMGWEAVAFSEIEPFSCAVLAARYPDVPNLGDITKIDWSPYVGAVDLVVGGSPCQSFSIAGGREGLDGESRLMYEYIRCVQEVRPRWFLWENVPGVFSIDKGRAFGILLDAMDEFGYGLAWRVLDAQFFGVAQRRRRVFLVGCLGEGGASAAVLFEPQSVSGNTQPSREKREELARAAGRGSSSGGFKFHQGARAGSIGYETEQSPSLTADYHNPACLCLQTDHLSQNGTNVSDNICKTLDIASQTPVVCLGSGQANAMIGNDVSCTLNCQQEQPIVCIGSDTVNASIDSDLCGTLHVGGGTPLIVSGLSARAITRESETNTCRTESSSSRGSVMTSNGDEVIRALCACDGPNGVSQQYFDDGKVICQKI